MPALHSNRTAKRLPWGARIAAVFLGVVVVASAAAPFISSFDPDKQDIVHKYAGWSWKHKFGTDVLGRDTFSRILYGGRMSLGIAVAATLASLVLALPIGLYAGYKSGKFDRIVMRVVDAFLCIPPLVAVLAIAVALGRGATTIIVALGAVNVPIQVRFIRNESIARRSEAFIEAAQVAGLRTWTVIRKHILPNILPALLVGCSFWIAAALLAEAGLSYIGAGVQPPTASWGSMLRLGVDNSLFTDAGQFLVPGIAIALVILAANTLGEGVRSSLGWSVRTRRRRGDRTGITATSVRDLRPVPPSETAAGEERPLLAIDGLSVEADVPASAPLSVLRGVSLDIYPGEIVGLVGESGSGKSVTAMSIMRLLPTPPMRITAGSVLWKDRDLLGVRAQEMREIRGNEIAMVFQDPLTSLDPNFSIGSQLTSAYRVHKGGSRRAARERARELLEQVEIPGGRRRLEDYPHQLSGGMRQRVMIAMALSCEPELLICDEATTALDVTVQASVIDLLVRLREEYRMAMLIVTHDLGVVDDMCDRVAVMYAGQIVERNSAHLFFTEPLHPYSQGLLRSNPRLDQRQDRLEVLTGAVPPLDAMPAGCRFAARCEYATDQCRTDEVAFISSSLRTGVRCVRQDELALNGAVR